MDFTKTIARENSHLRDISQDYSRTKNSLQHTNSLSTQNNSYNQNKVNSSSIMTNISKNIDNKGPINSAMLLSDSRNMIQNNRIGLSAKDLNKYKIPQLSKTNYRPSNKLSKFQLNIKPEWPQNSQHIGAQAQDDYKKLKETNISNNNENSQDRMSNSSWTKDLDRNKGSLDGKFVDPRFRDDDLQEEFDNSITKKNAKTSLNKRSLTKNDSSSETNSETSEESESEDLYIYKKEKTLLKNNPENIQFIPPPRFFKKNNIQIGALGKNNKKNMNNGNTGKHSISKNNINLRNGTNQLGNSGLNNTYKADKNMPTTIVQKNNQYGIRVDNNNLYDYNDNRSNNILERSPSNDITQYIDHNIRKKDLSAKISIHKEKLEPRSSFGSGDSDHIVRKKGLDKPNIDLLNCDSIEKSTCISNTKKKTNKKLFHQKQKETFNREMSQNNNEVEGDDFTTLLAKRLLDIELEASKEQNGPKVFKSDSLDQKCEEKLPKVSSKDYFKKIKNLQKNYNDTIDLSYVKTDEKKGVFSRKDIFRFQVEFKDQLYDTTIKIGKHFQAFIPEYSKDSNFIKIKYFYGIPKTEHNTNKNTNEIKYYQNDVFNLVAEPQHSQNLSNADSAFHNSYSKSDLSEKDYTNSDVNILDEEIIIQNPSDREIREVIENYCSRRKSDHRHNMSTQDNNKSIQSNIQEPENSQFEQNSQNKNYSESSLNLIKCTKSQSNCLEHDIESNTNLKDSHFKIKDLDDDNNHTTIIIQNEAFSENIRKNSVPNEQLNHSKESIKKDFVEYSNKDSQALIPSQSTTLTHSDKKNFVIPDSTIVYEIDSDCDDSSQKGGWKEVIVQKERPMNPSYVVHQEKDKIENNIVENNLYIKRRQISNCQIWDPECMTEEVNSKLPEIFDKAHKKHSFKQFNIDDFRDFMIECMCDGEECLREIFEDGALWKEFVKDRKQIYKNNNNQQKGYSLKIQINLV